MQFFAYSLLHPLGADTNHPRRRCLQTRLLQAKRKEMKKRPDEENPDIA
jgi:hypothetical protein